jgi:putative Mg2+ transporter-C (MgtC) family protein
MHELDIIWRLGLALLLSSAIGIEREMRQKNAGLRTHALVGLGAAVFMLVSAYGFGDVLAERHVTLDPSRVAAQIVSGIGFIGGGIIFVRRDSVVRGLTTAAAVWVTAAVGMACGGDLPIVAVAATVAYMLVAYGYPTLLRRIPHSSFAPCELRLVYESGAGTLRRALAECGRLGFQVSDLEVKDERSSLTDGNGRAPVTVDLQVRGPGPITELAAQLHDIDGVLEVHAEGERDLTY